MNRKRRIVLLVCALSAFLLSRTLGQGVLIGGARVSERFSTAGIPKITIIMAILKPIKTRGVRRQTLASRTLRNSSLSDHTQLFTSRSQCASSLSSLLFFLWSLALLLPPPLLLPLPPRLLLVLQRAVTLLFFSASPMLWGAQTSKSLRALISLSEQRSADHAVCGRYRIRDLIDHYAPELVWLPDYLRVAYSSVEQCYL